MSRTLAKFSIGQLICHRLFDYRGVVIDVDSQYLGTDQWYENMAKSRPPKDKPWYHVLVDGSSYQTYVAEQNLKLDPTNYPINHPEIHLYFKDLTSDGYILRNATN